jgi:hypothetical protein
MLASVHQQMAGALSILANPAPTVSNLCTTSDCPDLAL